jgi:pimeloyl-ACP methyl ester carboxylesterase
VIYRFDDVEIDVPKRELRRAGAIVAVEPMVLDVIVHLVHNAERVVAKTELLDELWGDRFVSESALTSRIKSARRVLGDDGRSQHVIRTVHGHGYRVVAPLVVTNAADPIDTAAGPAAPVDVSTIRFIEGHGGVSIAIAETGSGRPLVKAATWMTQVDKDTAASPIWGHWVTALSRRHRYVRYDPRGCGLSDRDLRGLPLDDLDLWVDDLARVIETTCGDEPVDLLGISQGGPVAVALAARAPERIAHLILFGTYARGMRRRDAPLQAQQAGVQVDLARLAWSSDTGAFREVFARLFVPEAGAEEIGWFNDQLRLTTDATMAPLLEAAFHDLDVSEQARAVTVPTLVMHAVGDEAVPFEEGRRLAGLVPGARFVPLHSRNHILLERDTAFGRFVEEIDRFTAT